MEEFSAYLEAFRELGTCRPSGMGGTGYIPFTSIIEYSKIYDVGEFEDFIYLIREMDKTYIDFASKKQEKGAKPNATKHTNPRNSSKGGRG